jgi:hypothetical protein
LTSKYDAYRQKYSSKFNEYAERYVGGAAAPPVSVQPISGGSKYDVARQRIATGAAERETLQGLAQGVDILSDFFGSAIKKGVANAIDRTKQAVQERKLREAEEAKSRATQTPAVKHSPLSKAIASTSDFIADLIPVHVPGGRKMDKTIGEQIGAIGRRTQIPGTVGDLLAGFDLTASMGLSKVLADAFGMQDRTERAEDTTGGKIGQAIGYLNPGGGGLAYRAAGRLTAPLVRNASSIVQNAARGAAAGGILQGGIEAGEALSGQNDQPLGERAREIALAVGIGGAGDAAIQGIGRLLSNVGNRAAQQIVNRSLETTSVLDDVGRESSLVSASKRYLDDIDEQLANLNRNAPDYEQQRAALENDRRATVSFIRQHEPDFVDEVAVSVPPDIDSLVREYQQADEAIKELDERFGRKYGANQPMTPDDLRQYLALNEARSQAAQKIQNAVRIAEVPEGVKARAAAGTELTAAATSTPPTAALPAGTVRARVTPPAGNRSTGPTAAESKPKKTISRVQLIENIRKNLGVTIDTGRTGYSRDQVLGVYKTQPEVIRTGYAEDYDTIAHEIGHHFVKQYNLLEPRYEHELLNMMDTIGSHDYQSYPRSEWFEEGVAEYMRVYLTDPDRARELAPEFTAHLESVLPKKTKRGLANVQRDIRTWIEQGPYEQAKGLIDFDGGGSKDRKASWNRWYTTMIDDLNPIRLAEKALTGTVNIGSKSIYKMARLSRGVGEQAKMAITRGIFDSQGNKLSDGLRQIVRPLEDIGMSEKDFATYLAAVHARDLKGMEKIIPFSDEQINAVMQKWGNNPVVQKAQQQIVQYNNALLDLLVEAQILSGKAVAEMRRKYPNYVPFMRYFDDDAVAGFKNGGYGSSKGFANITNPVKRMSEEGSNRTIINPIESMVKNTFLTMNAAAKNKVGLRLADLAEIEGAGAWVEKVPGGSDPNQHIINVKINGENQAYKIRDPDLYNALLSLDTESTNSLVKFLGGVAGLLRSGATLTPEFMIRNSFRDVMSAIINSTKYGFNPMDFFKGFFHVVTKSDVYEKFVNSGGAMSTMMALDRDANREAMEAIFRQSLKDKALNVVTSPGELAKFLSGYTPLKATVGVLRKGSEISELATKVGAFNKVLRKTGDLEEAAYTARDLMDFNRVGSAIRQANRAIAFLNATLQGTDKMVRAFKDNPASFLTRAFVTLVLPATTVYFWNRHNLSDDERAVYDNIPQYQKDNFFVLGIPGTGEFVRIPKPFEAGMLFATSTERMLEWLRENDPEAWEGYGRAVAESMTPPVLFTALTPLLEATTNHSFFRNAPVVPLGEQNREKKDQYGIYTSELAKEIGQFMDRIGLGETNAASPRIIDNTIRGYTAGLGQYAVDLIDEGIKAVRGDDGPAQPAKKWTEDPFFRSFFVSTAGGGQIRDDFYKEWDRLNKERTSAEFNETDFEREDEYKAMKPYKREIDKLQKEYKKIRDSKTLTAEQKRSQMDELDAKMNAAAAAALEKVGR